MLNILIEEDLYMQSSELHFTELKLQVLGQFSYLNNSLKELPKMVLPLLLDLSKFFENNRDLYANRKTNKKIIAVKMEKDEDEEQENPKHFQKRNFQEREEKTSLENAFKNLLSSQIKAVFQKKAFLKAQHRLSKKTALSKKNQQAFISNEKSDADQPLKKHRKIKKMLFQKIKPFLDLKEDIEIYQKVFSPIANFIADNERDFLKANANDKLFDMQEKLKKKIPKS